MYFNLLYSRINKFFKRDWEFVELDYGNCYLLSLVETKYTKHFNFLSPVIIIQILLTGLHTIHWVLIGRTCENINWDNSS